MTNKDLINKIFHYLDPLQVHPEDEFDSPDYYLWESILTGFLIDIEVDPEDAIKMAFDYFHGEGVLDDGLEELVLKFKDLVRFNYHGKMLDQASAS